MTADPQMVTVWPSPLLGLACLCLSLPALLLVACAALSARVERVRDEVNRVDGGEHGGFDL